MVLNSKSECFFLSSVLSTVNFIDGFSSGVVYPCSLSSFWDGITFNMNEFYQLFSQFIWHWLVLLSHRYNLFKLLILNYPLLMIKKYQFTQDPALFTHKYDINLKLLIKKCLMLLFQLFYLLYLSYHLVMWFSISNCLFSSSIQQLMYVICLDLCLFFQTLLI